MGALLGKANISDVSLQQLCDNRFMPAKLYGKMANLGGDLPAIDISDTATFKGLTGGDRMTVENKYGQPFEFDNRAKLVFSTNKLPKTPDDSYAFYSRWILIVFRHVFDVQQGTGDEGLDKKLQSPEELSGMLNIALDGLQRLKANGWKFSYSKTAEDVELLYKRMSDPIVAFLIDACEENFDAYIEKAEFYNAFKEYSQKNAIKPISPKKFWSGLKDQSEIPVSDYRPDNFSPRYVKGVALKTPFWGYQPDSSYWGKATDWSQDSHDYFTFPAQVSKTNLDGDKKRGVEVGMKYSQECEIIPAILAPSRELDQPGKVAKNTFAQTYLPRETA
jgi:phage/plasmid-associated DNA primase